MNVTLPIPDDLAAQLGPADDLARRALEALALMEYQAGRLTEAQLRRMLGFETRYELDGFLKARGPAVLDPDRAGAGGDRAVAHAAGCG